MKNQVFRDKQMRKSEQYLEALSLAFDLNADNSVRKAGPLGSGGSMNKLELQKLQKQGTLGATPDQSQNN